MQRQITHTFPEPKQVVKIALDFGAGALGTSGADNQSHALRHFHIAGHFLQATTITGIGDLAGNATTTGGIWHQHAVAASQRQIGCKGCTLVAAFFLDDLHQQNLATLDDFLDFIDPAAWLPTGALGNFLKCIFCTDGFNTAAFHIFLDGYQLATARGIAGDFGRAVWDRRFL